MIKSAEFVEQYRQGKVPASTLVKMAAFKNELETALSSKTVEELMKIAVQLPGWGAISSGLGKALEFSIGKGPNAVNIGQAVVGGALFGGAGMLFMQAVKAIEGKVVDWSNDFKKPKLFKEMMELHPELKEYEESLVKTYYEALWHFSPVMAENPLAAGAYIRQALTMHHVAGGPLPNSINEVTNIQKNWAQGTKDDGDSTMTTVMAPFKTGVEGFGKVKGKD